MHISYRNKVLPCFAMLEMEKKSYYFLVREEDIGCSGAMEICRVLDYHPGWELAYLHPSITTHTELIDDFYWLRGLSTWIVSNTLKNIDFLSLLKE